MSRPADPQPPELSDVVSQVVPVRVFVDVDGAVVGDQLVGARDAGVRFGHAGLTDLAVAPASARVRIDTTPHASPEPNYPSVRAEVSRLSKTGQRLGLGVTTGTWDRPVEDPDPVRRLVLLDLTGFDRYQSALDGGLIIPSASRPYLTSPCSNWRLAFGINVLDLDFLTPVPHYDFRTECWCIPLGDGISSAPREKTTLMKKRSVLLVAISIPLLGFVAIAGRAAGAAPIALPDMTIRVPTNLISIGTDSSNGHRILRFTHQTEDSGAGPLEMDPSENPATGVATFVQTIYNSPSPGVWNIDHTVPIAENGVFHPPSDYSWQFTSFTLYTANADGSLGTLVATSPKTYFCMTGDVRIGDVPNTPNATTPSFQNCSNPNSPLGESVGWADQYDQTDPGQPIDLTGIADGNYVLHAVVDPQHALTESNPNNNVTDTVVAISGTSLTVLSQSNPGTNLPTVSVTAPTFGSNVSGTVTLSASASAVAPASLTSVQFLLDGNPLGAAVTAAPYNLSWTVGSTSLGNHLLSARAADSSGSQATSATVQVKVVAPGTPGPLGVDTSTTQTGTGVVTTAPFTTTGPDTLIALAGADGSKRPNQGVGISGAGSTWTLVKRADSDLGTADIWMATASSALSNVTVTETPGQGGNFDSEITVVAFRGAGGVAAAAASAASGAPSVTITTTAAGSMLYAVGNDWTSATARVLASDQNLVAQYVDTAGVNTFWAQTAAATSNAAGQTVILGDTAPTADRWNMTAVEVTPASPAPPDTTPPSVNITNPLPAQVVSGTVPVAANASDNVAVASVQFLLDGKPLGAPVTTSPYSVSFDTTTSVNGTHVLTAVAADTSGNQTTSSGVSVTVTNPAPPPPACFNMDVDVSTHGHGTTTTPVFHTGLAGETLLAFVGSDGPSSSISTTISGAGLTWSLVKRANGQHGDAEIWQATAAAVLNNVTVTSAPSRGGFDQDLTVIAMQMTSGVGASAAVSAPSGAPSVSLTTTKAGSLVFAVGSDWDQPVARALVPSQVYLDQWVDTGTGDTYWSQYTNGPTGALGTVVKMADSAPTGDRWNMVAVELKDS